jgi:hypothetical protein
MSDPNHQDKFSPVKDIIDREKDQALGHFRKTDFESRLERRLDAGLRTESSFFFFLRKPVIVLSVSVLVCCAAALIIVQILSPSPHEKSVRVIEEFLRKNTNLQSILADERIPEKQKGAISLSFEEELECWKNPECRKKIFNQIINVFKEKDDDSESVSL